MKANTMYQPKTYGVTKCNFVEKNVHHIAVLYNGVFLLISLLNAEGKGGLHVFVCSVQLLNVLIVRRVNLWCLW